MIYEVRTYDLKPRSQPEFLKRFGEAYEKRKQFSEMAAIWTTEIGPLNQVIHIWPYKDLAERDRIRAEAVASGSWPPALSEYIVGMRSEIMIPWPDSPLLPKGNHGPYFEMRTYTINTGDQPKVRKAWAAPLVERTKLSPVIALWFSELGALNKFVHIWPYKTLDERVALRKKATDAGFWPPKTVPGPDHYASTAQETKILVAASFSPLK